MWSKKIFLDMDLRFMSWGAPRILEIVIEVILILRCFIVPAELAAIVRELLQQFSEAGPCGGGALLCNIFTLPFSMNGAARGYPLLEPEEEGEP